MIRNLLTCAYFDTSRSPILIIEPNNIILINTFSKLYLNDLKRYLSMV